MDFVESQRIELKQEYTPEIRKDVIAFANFEGGTIYVGISKDGETCGVNDSDEDMLKIANSLKDSIAPDIMPFVFISLLEVNGQKVIKIDVSVGTNRPYYIKEKGLKPSGVYIRKGSSSQPVSDDGIRQMIIDNSSISYEASRSIRQDLSFDDLQKELSKRNIEFGNSQMFNLKIIGEDNLFSNLALLLSDQCETTIKLARFQGTDKSVFRDRQEFEGSLITQLKDVYTAIDKLNATKAEFNGLNRIDTRDYPEQALREALINCVVHRDYSFSGSTIINVYDDRIEFVSLGGLVQGLTLESIYLGISQSRNPNLANLFYRMRLIESYGTGIGKIKKAYEGMKQQPLFETAPGAFRVTLPNVNFYDKRNISSDKKRKNAAFSKNDEKQIIMSYLSETGSITRQKAEELIQAGSTKAYKLLKQMCDEGIIIADGSGRLMRYVSTFK